MNPFILQEGNAVNEIVTSPAQENLRMTDQYYDVLTGKKRKVFYTVVSKMLYIIKRAMLDLETAISYLCTRVTKSNKYNWKIMKCKCMDQMHNR